jgi:lipoprotein NlpD
VVKRGDTLYQIALDSGLDYRELAAWNNLENVNVIRVGQVLRLTAPGSEAAVSPSGVTTAPLRTAPSIVESKPGAPQATPSPSAPAPVARNTDTLKKEPKAFKEAYSEQALRDATRQPVAPAPDTVAMATPTPAPAAPPKVEAPAPRGSANDGGDDDDRLDWVWPAKGKVVGTFSETANLKGIDIAGSAGQPVVASAAGTVVYAGTGLRGYGKLIIVKHNKTYLSAYAHNRDILVKEGEKVAKGQKIAEMGNSDASEVKLHFEIRRQGKPMDPTRYLPPA